LGASIKQIRVAMLAALDRLTKANGGPFDKVDHYRGEVTQTQGVDLAALGATTAALLALESERPEEKQGVATIVNGKVSTVETAIWRVYVIDSSMRDVSQELLGDADLGTDDMVDAVKGALTGLKVPAPPATLTVLVTGTPGATVPLTGRTLTAPDTTVYTPAVTSVILSGGGTGTITVATTTPGVLGTQAVGTTLTWDSTPAGASATAKVSAIVTAGQNGLYKGEGVQALGHVPHVIHPGLSSTYLLRFLTRREGPKVPTFKPGVPLTGLTADLNLIETADPAPNPFVQLDAGLAE
jgi:hypothetical protein